MRNPFLEIYDEVSALYH